MNIVNADGLLNIDIDEGSRRSFEIDVFVCSEIIIHYQPIRIKIQDTLRAAFFFVHPHHILCIRPIIYRAL